MPAVPRLSIFHGTYLFSLPLTFALPLVMGEVGIWVAGPIAEILMLVT